MTTPNTDSPEHDVECTLIPLADIVVGTRSRQDYGDLKRLKDSICKNGVIQSLAVERTTDGKYLLLAGGRRHKACTELKICNVPARVYPQELDNSRRKAIELAENADREDMSWSERDEMIAEVHEIYVQKYGEAIKGTTKGWSMDNTADLFNVSRPTVHQALESHKNVKAVPELKRCKTRKDMERLVKKANQNVTAQIKHEEMQQKDAVTPLEVQQRKLIDSFIVGDFLELAKNVNDNSCSIAEVDPPYGIDLHKLRKREDRTEAGTMDSSYNEVPADEYSDWIGNVIEETYRILRPGSWLIMWFGPDPWFNTVLQAIKDVGFDCKGIPGIWFKGRGYGQCVRPDLYMANSYETFFYARKGDATISKPGQPNVQEYKPVPPGPKVHPTERPIEMIQCLLDIFCDRGSTNQILVPFLGSGNTLLAANNLNITGFGYELDSGHKDHFAVKVREGNMREFKSYGRVENE